MEKRRLIKSDVELSSLGLGGGALGGMYTSVDYEEAIKTVQTAYESGITYFDTAPLYGHGRSETRIGEALKNKDRSTYRIGTKVGISLDKQSLTPSDNEEKYADPFLIEGKYDFSYDTTMRDLEASLKRLQTDYVDIAYIHDPDEGVNIEKESDTSIERLNEVYDGAYRALQKCKEEGIVKAIGIGVNGINPLIQYSNKMDLDVFLLAGKYTLLNHFDATNRLLPVCEEKGIKIVVGGVFNSGILAQSANDHSRSYNYTDAPTEVIEHVDKLHKLAEKYDTTVKAAAIQFPLLSDYVVAVIPGVRNSSEVDENIKLYYDKIPSQFWSDLKNIKVKDFA